MIESTTPLIIKFADSDAATAEFSGIAATWVLDRHGDTFAPGSFADTLKSWEARKAYPPLLWGHDQREPIGVVTKAQETVRGLEISGRIATGTANGRRASELLKTGAGALSLSVGIYPISSTDTSTGRLITKADWIEVSAVAIPAQPGAVIEYSTRKEFERAAREALQLSASQAKRLASGGFSAMARDESETEIDAEFISKQLYTIINSLKA